MKKNYADLTIGITEAIKNLRKAIDEASGKPIALLQSNKPIAYIVPVETYEQMQEEFLELKKRSVNNKD